jgi:hypothetical protein
VNATDPLIVSLNGRLDTAMALPSRRSIDFGQLLDCDDPAGESVKIINNGTVSTTISDFVLPDGSPFEVVTPAGFDIAPVGGERSIMIRFAPIEDGQFVDTLVIEGGPCDIREEIVLTGSRVTPTLRADDPLITMDTVYLCEAGTEGTFSFTNDGPVADTIRRYTQSGDAAFVLDDEEYPIVLAPGESYEFRLRFNPENERDYAGTLEFTWGPCDRSTIIEFTGEAYDPDVSLERDTLDFGQMDIDAGSTSKTIYLRNESGAVRIISSINMGAGSEFSQTTPASFPIVIPPHDSVAVEFTFDPDATGERSGSADIVVDDPCGEVEELVLVGEGTGTQILDVEFTIRVPDDLSGNVDDVVDIPLILERGSNVPASGISAMTVYLHWNYSLLLPESARPAGTSGNADLTSSSIAGDRRNVVVYIESPELSNSAPLATVKASVLLGNSPETAIAIDSVDIDSPPDRTYDVTLVDGKFTLLGICRLDGDRLVSTGGGLKVTSARPNPARDLLRLDVDVYDAGPMHLTLYNANGTALKDISASADRAGRFQMTVQVDALPSGYYYCVVRNSSGQDRVQFIVRR